MISNKEKCLEMWAWLAANPDKGKPDYMNYLYTQGRSSEYAPCWACREAKIKAGGGHFFVCDHCPVNWNPFHVEYGTCCSPVSPYRTWEKANERQPQDFLTKHQAALKIVHLINTTWEE